MQVCLYYNILIVMHDSYAGSNVISMQRGGNCLFRAVSYCMYDPEDMHSEIRSSTVTKIVNK